MKSYFFISFLVLFSSPSLANVGVMFGGGKLSAGYLKTTTSRHALFWQFDKQWLNKENNYLTWQLELASSHWNNEYFPDIHTISLTPVFHYIWQYNNYKIYAGGGIGITKLSADRLSSRKLGSTWLFEDKFVVGTELYKNHRIAFSINHYSNANLATENDGLTISYINYSYIW